MTIAAFPRLLKTTALVLTLVWSVMTPAAAQRSVRVPILLKIVAPPPSFSIVSSPVVQNASAPTFILSSPGRSQSSVTTVQSVGTTTRVLNDDPSQAPMAVGETPRIVSASQGAGVVSSQPRLELPAVGARPAAAVIATFVAGP